MNQTDDMMAFASVRIVRGAAGPGRLAGMFRERGSRGRHYIEGPETAQACSSGGPSHWRCTPYPQGTKRRDAQAFRFAHGPQIAKVMPGSCRLTNSVRPSGEKQAPANSL